MYFQKKYKGEIYYLIFPIIIAIITRLYSLYYNNVINPDGADCYIQQAKAIYYGQFDSITSCYPYLSLYPILIAFQYKIISNWVLAGQLVSLFFSILSFFPLYFLIKKFFNEKISFLVLFIWGCIPSYVIWSHYVIRDTVYWFFALSGLYFIISYLEKRNIYLFILSLIFFLLGAWCRVECLTYLLTSLLFFLILNKKNTKLLLMSLLFLCFFILICLVILLSFHIPVVEILPYEKIISRIKYLIYNYESLRQVLERFEDWDTGFGFHYFFSNTKNILWWIALGALLISTAKALYPPFFLILIIGLVIAKRNLKQNIKIYFILSNLILAFIILYLQVLYNWAISTRYIALLLFPGFIFLGYGLQSIVTFINNKFIAVSKYSMIFFCITIFLITFPKNFIREKNLDNYIYREIGYQIAKKEKHNKIIRIGGSFKRINLIYFYANLDFRGPVCFAPELRITTKELSSELLIKRNLSYYVSTSNDLKKISKDNAYKSFFKEVVTYNSEKHGVLKLLKIEK